MTKTQTAIVVALGIAIWGCGTPTRTSPTSPTVPVSTAPQVAITAATPRGSSPTNFTFELNRTDVAGVWRVDFGDDTPVGIFGPGSRVTTTHLYRAAGTYLVTARVNVDGEPIQASLSLTIR